MNLRRVERDRGVSGVHRNMRLSRLSFATAVTIAFLSLGCSLNPGQWPVETITDYLEKMSLKQVTLSQLPDGSYSGTGQDASGGTMSITVTQDPDAKKIRCLIKDAAGRVRGEYIEVY